MKISLETGSEANIEGSVFQLLVQPQPLSKHKQVKIFKKVSNAVWTQNYNIINELLNDWVANVLELVAFT